MEEQEQQGVPSETPEAAEAELPAPIETEQPAAPETEEPTPEETAPAEEKQDEPAPQEASPLEPAPVHVNLEDQIADLRKRVSAIEEGHHQGIEDLKQQLHDSGIRLL